MKFFKADYLEEEPSNSKVNPANKKGATKGADPTKN
jgi:hypothetical protein